MQTWLGMLAGAACFGLAAQAMAAPPPSAIGSWRGVANQTAVLIVITGQAGNAACKSIGGTMQNLPSGGASNILGWYCPATGRISFQRMSLANNDALQAYVGNIGDDAATDRMAGTFSAYPVAGAGLNGEYPFQLTR